jgi:hypothetical protein
VDGVGESSASSLKNTFDPLKLADSMELLYLSNPESIHSKISVPALLQIEYVLLKYYISI